MKSQSILWLSIGLLAILLYGLLDPEKYLFPKCPFQVLTGWKCAGCGSQRAIHQLLQGNFTASFLLNPLFMPALLYVLTGYAAAFFFPMSWPVIRLRWFGKNAAFVSLFVIISFWVGRNLI